ncbi:L-threonylcarbamoyladenylate synthase [Persephonella sp.]|uniref:L-threonylcarbamoyladenylate synthase n=1 Tax=Persephonella sp. TaxID=2060922 RepID=UPI0026278C8E|nr:L-threonylcarbamoyladenylate synthase [Persephonella sp.]
MSKVLKDFSEAIKAIKSGKIVIVPTDTLYGILANALDKNAVERVYKLKGRDTSKPFIILIPSVDYLSLFGIKPTFEEKKLLDSRGITVIIDLPEEVLDKFEYLHRGQKSLAFRIPDNDEFIQFLKTLKLPVIAPSANPERKKPASDIQEAIRYFGNKVNLYIDKGKLEGKPSTIVKVKDGLKILREGSKDIEEIKKNLKGH